MFNRIKNYWQRATLTPQDFDMSFQEAPADQEGNEDLPSPTMQSRESPETSLPMNNPPLQIPQHRQAAPPDHRVGEAMTVVPMPRSPNGVLLPLSLGEESSVTDGSQPSQHVAATLEEPDSHSMQPLSRRSSASTVRIDFGESIRSLPDVEDLSEFHEITTSMNDVLPSYQSLAATLPSLIPCSNTEKGPQNDGLKSQGHKRSWGMLSDITNTINGLQPQKRSRVPDTGILSQVSPVTKAPEQKPISGKAKDSGESSQLGFPQKNRESIENAATNEVRWNVGCRTWTADDVLRALHSGREEAQDSSDVTPPSSPLKTAIPLPIYQRTYNFGLPRSQPATGKRTPLSNITDHYVPDFLQAPQPEMSVEASPPSPGEWIGISEDVHFDTSTDEDLQLMTSESAKESRPGTNAQESTKTATMPSLSNERKNEGEAQDEISSTQPVTNHVLRGLTNDATFMKDSLKQIKALKAKVQDHEKHRDSAKEWLDINKLANTQSQKEKREAMVARYIQEAKAYDDAAKRAEAEAKEYRMKATQLLDNARLEVGLLLGDGDEHVGEKDEEESDRVE